MRGTLYLAWRYIAYHKVKTMVLVVAIAMIVYLPLALRTIVSVSQHELMARANSTPLIIGAKGSSLDLAIDTLYFERKPLEAIPLSQAKRVDRSGLTRAIPVYTRFRARGHTIVATTLDYFEFRGLEIARGTQMVRLGDCVLGASLAARLGLGPDDHLPSSSEDPFNIAGAYPLRMHVSGILRRAHTPDDLAVFVDLKTAWIMEGLGHGHQDLTRVDDSDVLLGGGGNRLTANEKLVRYHEITDENVESFHFHGDMSTYPITAVIVVPHDKKSEDLLRGRYLSSEETCQIIRPSTTIENLTATIFKVERLLNVVFLLIGVASLLLIILIVALSIRLRRREIQTMYKLGCSRLKIASMLAAEITIITAVALCATAIGAGVTSRYAGEVLRSLIL